MVQMQLPEGQATLADAARYLGVKVRDLDAGYGVVPTDPVDRLFVAMVDSRKATAVAARLGSRSSPAEGVFANPPMMPFGPPEG